MIERELKAGLELKWTVPPANAGFEKDGKVVDSPPVAVTPMTYDQRAASMFGAHRVAPATRKTVAFDWLVYGHGVTTRRRMSGNDLLTGPMSGCLIATWTDSGVRYAGHVGTIDNNPGVNVKVKAGFLAAMTADTTGFYPANQWAVGDIVTAMTSTVINGKRPDDQKVVALVTGAGDFYSILLLKFGMTDQLVVGGIKKVAALDATAIRAEYGPWKAARPTT